MEEFIPKILNFISSFKPYSQLGIGAVSGWLTGFLIMKIGKFSAIILGGAILFLKIAEIEELIDINWFSVTENVRHFSVKPTNNISIATTAELNSNIHNFIVSFIGGSLIGIGCS